MTEKKEKTFKRELKVQPKHPRKHMQLGRHVVTNVFQIFELNEKEVKELSSKGCRKWFIEKKKEK